MSKGTVDVMPAGTTSGTPHVLLGHHLKRLKLPTVLREYDKVAREYARDGVDHPRYLLRLVELELIDRERRVVERRIKQARFPATKSLDTFDFTAIPSLNKMLVLELARCEFILRRENVIALGNSGTGKTHVALALGLAACQKGFPVAFTTATAITFSIGPIDSKLGGVIAMFGAIAMLFVMPWLDTSKVRSAVYRPWYKLLFWLFVADAIMLGWLGSRPAEGSYVLMAQLATLFYFAFFLIIMPVLGIIETSRRLPNSITEAVLEKNKGR